MMVAELKRRSVFKVATVYIVVGWIVLQIASFFFESFAAPIWAIQSFSVLIILGFPVACVLAWAFETTPEGIVRHQIPDDHEHQTSWFDYLWATLLSAMLVVAAISLLEDWRKGEPESLTAAIEVTGTNEPIVVEQANTESQPSIAVLPFVNMSDDKDYFADGLSEEILNLLAKIPGLKVVGRTSSFAFKGRNQDLRDIGTKLNVTTVLDGSIRRSGDRIRITAQLNSVKDGYHIWSETYDRDMTDVFVIQDEIAAAIIEALRLQLVVSTPKKGLHTQNMEAYALYLEAVALRSEFEFSKSVEALNKAILLDAGFAEAHYLIAVIRYSVPLQDMPRNKEFVLIRRHIEASVSLDPNSVKISVFAELIKVLLDWDLSSRPEQGVDYYHKVLRRAYSADPGNNQMRLWESFSYLRMGYFKKALEFADEIVARDPLFYDAQIGRLIALEGLGREQEAQQVTTFLVENTNISMRLIFQALKSLVDGDTERAGERVRQYLTKNDGDALTILSYLESLIAPTTRNDAMGSTQWQLLYNNSTGIFNNSNRSIVLYIVKDDRFWVEFMERPSAILNSVAGWPSGWFLNDPRFRKWAEQAGFVGYVKNHGLPDFCDGTLESWICELHD